MYVHVCVAKAAEYNTYFIWHYTLEKKKGLSKTILLLQQILAGKQTKWTVQNHLLNF